MASVFELAQQINRKKQQAQGGGNQFFDNSMAVMEHLEQRGKEGTARKIKGMEVALGDFNKVYDNTTLTNRMDVFEKRFGGKNLNKLNADERAAYDNAKIMMTRQMDKNTDFSMYQNKLKDTTKAMNDWMTSADGDTQPDPDAMNQILLDYMDTRANFSTTHQDRLSLSTFDYLEKEMDSIHEMGMFGIASMKDDGILSEGEFGAMAQSLTSLDPKPINEFKKNRDATEADGYKANVKAMDNDMKLYKGYQDIKNRIFTNEVGETGYYEGGDEDKFVRMSQENVDDALYGIKKRLGNLDNRYQQSRFNEEGKSYLEMSGFNELKTPLHGGENKTLQESVESGIVKGDDISPKITDDKVELEENLIEIPTSKLKDWGSFKSSSQSTQNEGFKDFLKDKKRSLQGDVSFKDGKQVYSFDRGSIDSVLEQRINSGLLNPRKSLSKDSEFIREMAESVGLKPEMLVELLEPKRKELLKAIKEEQRTYRKLPQSKKEEKKIQKSNKSIQKAFQAIKKSSPSAKYNDFYNQVVSSWENLSDEEKSKYNNSFDKFIESNLSTLETSISLIKE